MAWLGLLVGTLVGLGLLGSPVGLKPDQIALIWMGCGALVELARGQAATLRVLRHRCWPLDGTGGALSEPGLAGRF